MPNQKYIIGTRGSLLALTQCGQIKDQLEKITGDDFELKVITTQGDIQTDKPLWQLDGKDFFTKELDSALLLGEVDFVVHSYKDLGSERPEGIGLAAITKRDFAQDILFIKKQTILDINNKDEFIVGTSSPRRIFNIEKSLAQFLPSKKPLIVKTKMLRGNVNTRIQKLVDGNYDAIVLALPGIERLALTPSSRLELEKLLDGLDYMILPQSVFPSAASQGALGIEYNLNREDKGNLLGKLKRIEDPNTVSEISRERQAFNQYGGGCHLAVGINVFKAGDYYLHNHKGFSADKNIDETHLEGAFTSHDNEVKQVFIGFTSKRLESLLQTDGQYKLDYFGDEYIVKTALENSFYKDVLSENKHIYVTSHYCLEAAKKFSKNTGLFSSGIKTMKDLVSQGQWVNATADSRGDSYLQEILSSRALQLIHKNSENQSLVLSHDKATSIIGNIIPVYKRSLNTQLDKESLVKKLENTSVFYWTSYNQYCEYTKLCPSIKTKFHCTGLGKTLYLFKENNIIVRPFSSVNDFIIFTKKF